MVKVLLTGKPFSVSLVPSEPANVVAGGSGFIASRILDILIEKGYDVVTTVRSAQSGNKILERYPKLSQDRLQYVVVEDITNVNSLTLILTKMCDYQALQSSNRPFDGVIHTAAPFTQTFSDPVKEMLDPAIKGTTAVLKAVKQSAPSVKRVVLTSSFIAMFNPQVAVYDGTSWNPVTRDEAVQNPRFTYSASKTLAEKAAWAFIDSEKPSFDLVSINPPLVFGPLRQHIASLDKVNTSNQRIRDMVQGKFSDKLPPTGIHLWVDVRDVALAHVRALEVPQAGGNRFLVAAGHMSNKKIAEAVIATHPELRSRLPAAEQLVDDTPPNVYGFDNAKAVEVLGITFRSSLRECVGDTVESLAAVGGI
ncbi:ketoreductase [Apodospora peruviana]|uniref:Ketoreductase n=1 Tax=Apodospora peruviana TaxID=516989 RepID=A0AAE0IHK8_9PEZI|nr:ketoreductase [Apodospora peruviana]